MVSGVGLGVSHCLEYLGAFLGFLMVEKCCCRCSALRTLFAVVISCPGQNDDDDVAEANDDGDDDDGDDGDHDDGDVDDVDDDEEDDGVDDDDDDDLTTIIIITIIVIILITMIP